tara:strand:- start:7864 stop:8511 length:648 start_codon:yes stop_codon:yes gene_type:complete
VKLGDLLLLKGYISDRQLKSALHKQADEAITYNRSVPLGKVLIEMKFVTIEEVAEALNDQFIHKPKEKEVEPMAHKIGETTSFQMDLKFLVTIGVVLVSAVGVYFTLTGAVEDNTKEIDNIKSMGDLKIISYKLDEYDETFKELKQLNTTLSPLATDLTYIKTELDKLKNRKIDIPEVDLSGIDDCKDKLDDLAAKLDKFEQRLTKVEKSSKGRF